MEENIDKKKQEVENEITQAFKKEDFSSVNKLVDQLEILSQ